MEKAFKIKLLLLFFIVWHGIMGWFIFSAGFDNAVTLSNILLESLTLIFIGIGIVALSAYSCYAIFKDLNELIPIFMNLYLAIIVVVWLMIFILGVSFWSLAPDGEEAVIYDACKETFIHTEICDHIITYLSFFGMTMIVELFCLATLYLYKRAKSKAAFESYPKTNLSTNRSS